jgi:hypothetical protein
MAAKDEKKTVNLDHIRGLNEKQAAHYIGFSSQYLRASRLKNRKTPSDAPPCIKIGGRIVYLRDDLDKWLDSHRQEEVAK